MTYYSVKFDDIFYDSDLDKPCFLCSDPASSVASNPFHDAEGILGVDLRSGPGGVLNHIPSLHWPPKVSVASASSGGGVGMAITHHLEREESALHSNSGISYDLPRSRPGQKKMCPHYF